MSNYRIKKDIKIVISLLTNTEPIPLENRNLKVILLTPLLAKVELPFTVEGNKIITNYKGVDHQCIGPYRLTVWENYETDGQTAVDFPHAFTLVPNTTMEGGSDPEGLDTEVVNLSGNIAVGIQGKSAYEVAVSNGFVGTEAEWVASLKGDPFTYADYTPEQIEELQRPATEAAAKCDEATKAAKKAVADLPQKDVVKENVNDVTI